MANFHKPGRERGSKNFGKRDFGKRDFGKRGFGGRSAGKPGMHKAICDDCGNSCEVPFKPTGNRPVLCNHCFRKDDKYEDNRDFGDRDFGGRDSRRSSMFEAICDECGDSCEVPFRPSGNKPVFCDNCFRKDGGGKAGRKEKSGHDSASNLKQFQEQLEILNIKLDRIFKILTSPRQDFSQEIASSISPKEHSPKEKKSTSETKGEDNMIVMFSDEELTPTPKKKTLKEKKVAKKKK